MYGILYKAYLKNKFTSLHTYLFLYSLFLSNKMKYFLAIILNLILLEVKCDVVPFQEIFKIGQKIQESTNSTLVFAHVVSKISIIFNRYQIVILCGFNRYIVMENAAPTVQRI